MNKLMSGIYFKGGKHYVEFNAQVLKKKKARPGRDILPVCTQAGSCLSNMHSPTNF